MKRVYATSRASTSSEFAFPGVNQSHPWNILHFSETCLIPCHSFCLHCSVPDEASKYEIIRKKTTCFKFIAWSRRHPNGKIFI